MKNKLISMLNEWFNFESALKEDYGDVTVDMARANYKEYEQMIKGKQQKYIKILCEDIKIAARSGKLNFRTSAVDSEEFMTQDFLQELKTYFLSKGFKVRQEIHPSSFTKHCLVISWEEDNNNE